ncbi:MAG: hypothetical protein BAJALOKI1v1_1820002 [Promethearchaeota archaeon]|nr:MAG: hypothetical protein BAJALOKI1v1_1820002 [Candidatus Lokiarchaeota archaeon]
MNEEKKYPIIISPEDNPCFISLWDEEIGPKIMDLYPRWNSTEIEELATHIFSAYQYFWDIPDAKFENASFVLPVKKLEKKAKVVLDSIPNSEVRGGFQPYIVVLLVPDFLTKKQIKNFDDILILISQEYAQNLEITPQIKFPLKEYYQEIQQRFDLIEYEEEKEPEISDFYSYTAAVEDFQAAINLFEKGSYKKAYELLMKVSAKFKKEKHDRLLMEVYYLIGSIFAQQKKYRNAQHYFQKLEELAQRFDHERFREISIFMDAFCYYKNQYYELALEKLEILELFSIHHINQLQYLTVYAKVLNYLSFFNTAEQKLLHALDLTEEITLQTKLEEQARLYYELGILNYKKAYKNDFKSLYAYTTKEFITSLEKAMAYFQDASQRLETLKQWEILNEVYIYLSYINELLDNKKELLNYLHQAYQGVAKTENILKLLNILLKITNIQAELGYHTKNVEMLKDFLANHEDNRILDLFTKGRIYKELANSLLLAGDELMAIETFIEAHEIFARLSAPIYEDYVILNKLKRIYEKNTNLENISKIEREIASYEKALEGIKTKKEDSIYPLGELQELWIFSNDSGLLMYSYAPNTGIDHDLIGGFLTALKQLSIQVTQQEIEEIAIGKDRFTLYQEQGYNYFILGRSSIMSIPTTIKQTLKIIYKRFWKEYAEKLKNFSGNVGIFQNFTKIIKSLDFTLIS